MLSPLRLSRMGTCSIGCWVVSLDAFQYGGSPPAVLVLTQMVIAVVQVHRLWCFTCAAVTRTVAPFELIEGTTLPATASKGVRT